MAVTQYSCLVGCRISNRKYFVLRIDIMHKSKLEEKLEKLEEKYTNEEERDSDLGSVITLKEKEQIDDSDDPDLEDKIKHMIDFHKD